MVDKSKVTSEQLYGKHTSQMLDCLDRLEDIADDLIREYGPKESSLPAFLGVIGYSDL